MPTLFSHVTRRTATVGTYNLGVAWGVAVYYQSAEEAGWAGVVPIGTKFFWYGTGQIVVIEECDS